MIYTIMTFIVISLSFTLSPGIFSVGGSM